MRTHISVLITIALLAGGAAPIAADDAANKKLVQRYFTEMLNEGRVAVADEILAADAQFTNPPTAVTSREDLKKVVTGLRAAFPDFRFEVAEVVAEGDTVAARWTLTGTHRGPLQGFEATGKTIRVTGMDFFHFKDGRIRQVWVNMDVLGMLQQLGALPAPPP
jgi:steroid delta-isomerase-like uncharacterized protein